MYQHYLDKWTPHTASRWVFTMVLIAGFMLRIMLRQGWYIVCYALGIYHLNLFLAFLTPKIDPAFSQDDGEAVCCVGLCCILITICLIVVIPGEAVFCCSVLDCFFHFLLHLNDYTSDWIALTGLVVEGSSYYVPNHTFCHCAHQFSHFSCYLYTMVSILLSMYYASSITSSFSFALPVTRSNLNSYLYTVPQISLLPPLYPIN